MADFFFGFDTSAGQNSGLEDEVKCSLEDDELGEEEEYDALNDETFGSEATIGDWEKDHEKLARITESSRPHNQSAPSKKNGTEVDIQDNLSHLVLDEKDGIVPRPGVWDSPSNLSLPKPRPPLSIPPPLTNICTVEELEKGLIANRPPPGLVKPPQAQLVSKSDGSLLFNTLSLNEKLQINGLLSPRFPRDMFLPSPHPVVLPPNMRFPHPQFMQHPRLLSNQARNVLRYPLPAHLMMQHGPQRQPIHGSFCGTFPQPPDTKLGPPPFLRPDHNMMPPFSNSQNNHQQQPHSYPRSGNQRNHNRSYQHNDQPGNNQPFFQNNQYLYRNHDRNNQRHPHYHQHSHGMNGMTGSGEYDEYAGLMSSRDKQFITNIQLLQLSTNEPYVGDYYYIVFSNRQKERGASQDKKHNDNNGYHRDSRDRDQSQRVLTKSAYTPTQFENSLGKLQSVSVIAPRKLIDMDVIPSNDPQAASQMQQKDAKKMRQLLLEIERLYIIQLKLEDLSNPLALLNEQHVVQQRAENEVIAVKKTGPELINMLFTSLLQLIQEDKLASMLSIRKGKALLLRFLPGVNVTQYHSQLEELWVGLFRGLSIIGRRDSQLLMSLYSEFRRWVSTVRDFRTILRLSRALSDSVSQPMKNNNLAFALVNKFGVSVIASILEQAEQLYPTEDSLSSEWSTFVVSIVEVIGEAPPCVAPCQPIAANTLNQHLNRITSLKIERYTTLELLLTHANPSL